MHDGIFIIHFTAGRRRENGNADFGKEAVGNELSGNAFFRGMMPSIITEVQGSSETCVSDHAAGFMMVNCC
ncbi:TPA: hypothetical protein HA361_05065 [Candidatus Woesearchaeota archaeon]|nr:hypothetical protein [Candidatus Woesearchaeota archaeon]